MFYFPNKPIRVYDPARLLTVMPAAEWIAQPKWDGKRVEIECSDKGKVQLYSREGNTWGSDDWQWLVDIRLPRPWFLDGELLRDGRIYVWDLAVAKGIPVFHREYAPRLKCLQETLPAPIVRGETTLACIETVRASDYSTFMVREGSDHLEGVVFKKLNATNFWGPKATTEISTQFKYRFR
jgi:ATP-dependent DNA ligase